MGQFRFLTPPSDLLPEDAVSWAYLAGMEGIPWRSRNTLQDGILTLDRGIHESGNLFVPCRVDSELVTLSTASLMERERPYELDVELARGTLNRVRNFLADFQQAGFKADDDLLQGLAEAQESFVTLVTSTRSPSDRAEEARVVIEQSLALGARAVEATTRYLLELRRRQTATLPTLLACALDQLPATPAQEAAWLATFNWATIPVLWHDIEPNAGRMDFEALDARIAWCQAQGLRVGLGPLLRLDRPALPDWIYLWEDDFEQLVNCMLDYVRTLVKRYTGRVHIWHVAARMNVGGELSLTEEQRLRLVVAAVDTVRRADQQAPIIVSFDQPWGEYLATDDYDLSPLHFADALARADLGIAGFGLEMNFSCWPGGTYPRDLIEIGRQVDRWAVLNVPLLMVITAPSDGAPDEQAWNKATRVMMGTRQLSPTHQKNFVDHVVPLLISKPAVHGIVWNQMSDAFPHAFPHGGLWDSQHNAKPALAALRLIRKKLLG